MGKVILGFSGGIDSTAAAIMLREAGHEVLLLTLQTIDSTDMLDQACRQAEKLGIPWEYYDIREKFRRTIVDYFIDSYRRGETPAPCTVCNTLIKWPVLYDTMLARGYDHIATGHYVRIEKNRGSYCIRRGIDPHKDQSYYLWDLPSRYLTKALTPLGNHYKRDIVRQYGTGELQRESMGVCFLRGRSCQDFLREHLATTPGEVVDRTGRIIGRHDGCALYTIGQKKGLYIDRVNWAVTAIDPPHNRLQAGESDELLHRHLILHHCRITDPSSLRTGTPLSVQIRGVGENPGGYAQLIRQEADRIHLQLDEPARAAAPGQPVVLYEQDRVLGGGYLKGYF